MISIAALARALGRNRAQVRKYLARGMPQTTEHEARAWLAENSVGAFGKESGCEYVSGAAAGADVSAAQSDRPEDLSGLSAAELTMRLLAARIKLVQQDTAVKRLQEREAQMDADIRDGRLLKAEDVEKRQALACRVMRDSLLSLDTAWAIHLAAMNDPVELSAYTHREHKRLLIEFCRSMGVITEEDAKADLAALDRPLAATIHGGPPEPMTCEEFNEFRASCGLRSVSAEAYEQLPGVIEERAWRASGLPFWRWYHQQRAASPAARRGAPKV